MFTSAEKEMEDHKNQIAHFQRKGGPSETISRNTKESRGSRNKIGGNNV